MKQTQQEKKNKLYNEYRTTVKGKNRKQIKKHWSVYRSKKYTIQNYPKLRKKYIGKTVEQKENILKTYQEKRDIKTQVLQFGTLKLVKKNKQKYSQQDFYQLKKGNLDNVIKKIFDKDYKNVEHILITYKLKVEDIDKPVYVSDTLTTEKFRRLQAEGYTLNNNMLEKINFIGLHSKTTVVKDYRLMDIYVRLIYKLK